MSTDTGRPDSEVVARIEAGDAYPEDAQLAWDYATALQAQLEAAPGLPIDESRLEEIEQRVRDASERGGRNWYKTDVPELLRAVRVERERAERLERQVRKESVEGENAWERLAELEEQQ